VLRAIENFGEGGLQPPSHYLVTPMQINDMEYSR